MAAHNTPRHAPTDTALNPVEVRLTGGMLALNRFLMTLQNKRMPIASFTVGRDGDGMRATILLDCPPESARRYATLLSALEDVEDVEEIEAARDTVEVALLKVRGENWRESAARAGIETHEDGGTVVASGEPEKLEAWLAGMKDELEDVVRLGPMARPGDEGV
jgi:transposase